MDTKSYSSESAGSLMTQNIPVFFGSDKVSDVLNKLHKEKWDDIKFIYITNKEGELVGYISLSKLLPLDKNDQLSKVMKKPPLTVSFSANQEQVVIEAVKNDLTSVPVVDNDNKFLGVVTADKLIDVLHEEHLEDFLRSSGIRGKGSHIIVLATSNLLHIVMARLPWLIVGLSVGLGLGVIASRFEGSFQQNIALAFFIPVIAYIAGSVGTQTETIFIRAWALIQINLITYILKELIIGVIMGIILGIIGGLGAILISNTPIIGFVVGLSLFIAVSTSTITGCLVPILFKSFGKDPALGSGPLATAIQDTISLLIYFVIATIVL